MVAMSEQTRWIFMQANSFHESADRLRELDNLPNFPWIVFTALAIELYLKCAIVTRKPYKQHHNLFKLFQELLPEDQESLKAEFGKSGTDIITSLPPAVTKKIREDKVASRTYFDRLRKRRTFEEFMIESSDAFMKFRYNHEQTDLVFFSIAKLLPLLADLVEKKYIDAGSIQHIWPHKIAPPSGPHF